MLSELLEETIEDQISELEDLRNEETIAAIGTAVDQIHGSNGGVFTTGIGKSGDIAKKIASTLSSVGVSSHFLHPVEALHGDIGAVSEEAVAVFISNSGNTDEVVDLADVLEAFGPATIAITSNPDSKLANRSDIHIDTRIENEGSFVDLVPMASATATMVVGDAIANGLMYRNEFDQDDYGYFHPSGTIGKKLHLTVEDIMVEDLPPVRESDSLPETTLKMSRGGKGIGVVLDDGTLQGVITDGDIRRVMESERKFTGLTAGDVMTADPITITPDEKALSALNILERHNITQLVVTEQDSNRYRGVVHFHDIMKEGLQRPDER